MDLIDLVTVDRWRRHARAEPSAFHHLSGLVGEARGMTDGVGQGDGMMTPLRPEREGSHG
jgi:hypothetical protein